MKLWVDALRPPPDSYPSPHNPDDTISPGWWWAKNSKAAIHTLSYHHRLGECGPVDTISLDHDLGGDDTSRPIVLWMHEHGVWPDTVLIHTTDPVGREWLQNMIAWRKPGED